MKKTKQKKEVAAIPLPALMDFARAPELLKAMLAAVEQNDVRLQGADVSRITTPCVQILLSTAKTLQENGGSLSLEAPSPALVEAFNDLGLSQQLASWRV